MFKCQSTRISCQNKLIFSITIKPVSGDWLHNLIYNLLQLPPLQFPEQFHLSIIKCSLSILCPLPQVWRQFESVNMTSTVSDDKDWFFSVECNMVQDPLLLGYYCLDYRKCFDLGQFKFIF